MSKSSLFQYPAQTVEPRRVIAPAQRIKRGDARGAVSRAQIGGIDAGHVSVGVGKVEDRIGTTAVVGPLGSWRGGEGEIPE